MPSSEDKMQRKADGTYTVTLTGLSLDRAVELIANARNGGNAVAATSDPDKEINYR